MSSDRGHDPRWQKVIDCIDEHGPTDTWKKNAKVDVTVNVRVTLYYPLPYPPAGRSSRELGGVGGCTYPHARPLS